MFCTSPRARLLLDLYLRRPPEYGVGQYAALWFAEGGSLMHDLENIGDEDLTFITVEYLASANDPLRLD